MVFVGAVIMPHGALPFDNAFSPSAECRQRHQQLEPQNQTKFNELYTGTLNAAQEIANLNPDLIILHTPHGMCLSESIGIYANDKATGSGEWNDKWSEFQVSVDLDKQIAERLYGYLLDRQVRIESISTYGGIHCHLHWGEAIPIWYLCQKLTKKVKYVIMTHPRKLGTGQVEIEKLNVGRLMSDFMGTINPSTRVVVAISGDLSHTYKHDCKNPLYQPHPSSSLESKVNHEAALSFERAIKGWVKGLDDLSLLNNTSPLPDDPATWNPGNAMGWINKAATIHPQALACGMTGFMVLHGILAGCVAKGQTFQPKLHVCAAPTYYGMIAATFVVK